MALNGLAVEVKSQGNPEAVDAKQNKLNSRWANLRSKAEEEQGKLDHALQNAEELQQQHETISNKLEELEQQLAKCEPVGTEVHHIKQQLEEHKEFRKNMEPYQRDVDVLNESGLAIMKVCKPDDKTKVDDQLGDVNSRWNALTHQSAARQRELEEALLAAGQFQEALDELLTWVRDKEASLQNAEPTTGDVEKLKLLLDKHEVSSRQTDWWIDRQTDGQTGRDRRTDRQPDRQRRTDGQPDRQRRTDGQPGRQRRTD